MIKEWVRRRWKRDRLHPALVVNEAVAMRDALQRASALLDRESRRKRRGAGVNAEAVSHALHAAGIAVGVMAYHVDEWLDWHLPEMCDGPTAAALLAEYDDALDRLGDRPRFMNMEERRDRLADAMRRIGLEPPRRYSDPLPAEDEEALAALDVTYVPIDREAAA